MRVKARVIQNGQHNPLNLTYSLKLADAFTNLSAPVELYILLTPKSPLVKCHFLTDPEQPQLSLALI